MLLGQSVRSGAVEAYLRLHNPEQQQLCSQYGQQERREW